MSLLWYVLAFFILIFLIIINSNVKIHILFNREEKNDFLEFEFNFIFGIHIRKKIPIIQLNNINEGVILKEETQLNNATKNVDKERVTVKKVRHFYRYYQKLLLRIDMFKKSIRRFFKHVYVEEYSWTTLIGTGEAKNTGIVSGIFWGIKNYFIGLLSAYAKLEQMPKLSITPEYNKKIFSTRIDCIIKFKMGHVILLGIRLIFKYIIGGIKNVWRTSYSRLNANCHGKFKRDG